MGTCAAIASYGPAPPSSIILDASSSCPLACCVSATASSLGAPLFQLSRTTTTVAAASAPAVWSALREGLRVRGRPLQWCDPGARRIADLECSVKFTSPCIAILSLLAAQRSGLVPAWTCLDMTWAARLEPCHVSGRYSCWCPYTPTAHELSPLSCPVQSPALLGEMLEVASETKESLMLVQPLRA